MHPVASLSAISNEITVIYFLFKGKDRKIRMWNQEPKKWKYSRQRKN